LDLPEEYDSDLRTNPLQEGGDDGRGSRQGLTTRAMARSKIIGIQMLTSDPKYCQTSLACVCKNCIAFIFVLYTFSRF